MKKNLTNKMQINQHPSPQQNMQSPFKISRSAVNCNFAPMARVTRDLLCACPTGASLGTLPTGHLLPHQDLSLSRCSLFGCVN